MVQLGVLGQEKSTDIVDIENNSHYFNSARRYSTSDDDSRSSVSESSQVDASVISEPPEFVSKTVDQLRDFAKIEFSLKNYHKAIQIYTFAINRDSIDDLTKSILLSNRHVIVNFRAACYINTEELDNALLDCNESILLNPDNVKSYVRRSTIYQETGKWHEASADINKAIEIDPSLRDSYQSKANFLKSKSDALLEDEKTEVISKLKDLGNNLLGKIGLSLDNFKVEKNPQTGGYNIQFKQ